MDEPVTVGHVCDHEWSAWDGLCVDWKERVQKCLLCGRVRVWKQTIEANPQSDAHLGEWKEIGT